MSLSLASEQPLTPHIRDGGNLAKPVCVSRVIARMAERYLVNSSVAISQVRSEDECFQSEFLQLWNNFLRDLLSCFLGGHIPSHTGIFAKVNAGACLPSVSHCEKRSQIFLANAVSLCASYAHTLCPTRFPAAKE